ncbi:MULTISPECIES: type VI secretion system Vgr family protein [Cupriavidus]
MPSQSDLRFTFAVAGSVEFEVIEFDLHEALSETFHLDVQLAHANAGLDFASILDQPAVLTIWHGARPVRHVQGRVSTFEAGDTGFRRTRYRAVVEPTLARLRLGSDWRIFQTRSVPEIIQAVLADYGITDYEQVITNTHLPREYCVQSGETDFQFLQRIAAEEGLFHRFAFSADGHRLIHGDRLYIHGAIDGGPVHYQPNPGGDQPEPALRRFTYTEHVRTARQTQRDYTFKHPRYRQEHTQVGSGQGDGYERYDYPGRYKQDAAGRPFTENRLLGHRRDARMAMVEGDDPRLVPGVAFDLIDHPREDLNHGWRPVRMHHHGVQHTSQAEESAGAQQGTHYRYTAEIIPDRIEWRPEPCDKPVIAGPQVATVVGPEGEEIYVDEYGRVKVQFPWDRQGREDERSSCWVRVAQGWAGGRWGHIAIPRIGQEVIVDYLDGDCDQPIITSRVFNATQPVPYALPKHNILSVIKSQEHKGQRASELRIDDTTGEISAALMNDHGASALHLGYLTHPRPGGGAPRGEGFELRTDKHGAVRAASGLLLTTEPRPNATAHHKDLKETAERLAVAGDQQDGFAIMAREVLAQETGDQDDVANTLKNQHLGILGSGPGDPGANAFPEFAEPHLVLASPAGIALSTPATTHIASGEHLALSSTGHTSLAIGKRLLASASRGMRLFVQSLGWRLVAASGDIDLRALKDSINLLAKLNVTASADRITIHAKTELVINGGGSATVYNAGGITHQTSGSYIGHASSFTYTGARSRAASFPEPPKPSHGNLELFNEYASRRGIRGGDFQVEDALGKIIKGKLDASGFAVVSGAAPGPARVNFGKDPADTWSDDSYVGRPEWSPAGSGAGSVPGAVLDLVSQAMSATGAASRLAQAAAGGLPGGASALAGAGTNALQQAQPLRSVLQAGPAGLAGKALPSAKGLLGAALGNGKLPGLPMPTPTLPRLPTPSAGATPSLVSTPGFAI